MKNKLSLLFAVAALALAPAIHAADKPQSDKKGPAKQTCEHCKDACKCEAGKCACDDKQPEKKTVMLTGSHLPQTVTKVGHITDSALPLTVLTREQLELSGASDVGSALRKLVPQMR